MVPAIVDKLCELVINGSVRSCGQDIAKYKSTAALDRTLCGPALSELAVAYLGHSQVDDDDGGWWDAVRITTMNELRIAKLRLKNPVMILHT